MLLDEGVYPDEVGLFYGGVGWVVADGVFILKYEIQMSNEIHVYFLFKLNP